MRKRVELVAALFREAGKAIHSMPSLLLQPLYTLAALIILCAGWIYAAVWIESAGTPTIENGSHSVFFQKDTFLQVRNFGNLNKDTHISILFYPRLLGGTTFSPPFG